VEGREDIFFQNIEGGTEGLDSFISGFYNATGLTLDPDTLLLTMTAALKYDAMGILENCHLEGGISMMTDMDEEVSVAVELDISQGEWANINQMYVGKELIKVYDNWVDPDAEFTITVQKGGKQKYKFGDPGEQTVLTLEMETSDQVSISAQVWDDNPSGTSPGFVDDNAALYFAIDVDKPEAIIFPIIITVDLPGAIPDNVSDDMIADLFKVYTYDEGTDTWNAEDFPLSIDREKGKITIEVTHLSVFAVGGVVSENTDTSGNVDIPFEIPGYPFAIIGAISLISLLAISRKYRK
jgi:hypothetical protein